MNPPASEDLTDEALAARVQQGERLALAALVERHHAPLLGYLYRVTGADRWLAEDLVQETFLRVLRAIGQYVPPRPFKPWLYAIATNLARDHYRRAETRLTDGFPDDEAGLPAAPAPEADLLSSEQARQVGAAVAALPGHQRETLLLRYGQGLALEEISQALNIPVGTVKSRLSLGLKRLAENLRQSE